MKLLPEPFEKIKSGQKTLEFRLYDEKRQNIKIGDQVEFSNIKNMEEKLMTDVVGLIQKDTFGELTDDGETLEVLRKLYSTEEEKRYGVLGIKIKLNI
jgi:ASC-1-like (ASCH) protein